MLTACALLDFQHDRLSHSESSVSEHVRRSRLKAVEHVYTTKLETRSSWTRGRRMTLHSLKRHHPVGLSHQSSGAATADELQDIKVHKGGGSKLSRVASQVMRRLARQPSTSSVASVNAGGGQREPGAAGARAAASRWQQQARRQQHNSPHPAPEPRGGRDDNSTKSGTGNGNSDIEMAMTVNPLIEVDVDGL